MAWLSVLGPRKTASIMESTSVLSTNRHEVLGELAASPRQLIRHELLNDLSVFTSPTSVTVFLVMPVGRTLGMTVKNGLQGVHT